MAGNQYYPPNNALPQACRELRDGFFSISDPIFCALVDERYSAYAGPSRLSPVAFLMKHALSGSRILERGKRMLCFMCVAKWSLSQILFIILKIVRGRWRFNGVLWHGTFQ